jgi:hypothetical protein
MGLETKALESRASAPTKPFCSQSHVSASHQQGYTLHVRTTSWVQRAIPPDLAEPLIAGIHGSVVVDVGDVSTHVLAYRLLEPCFSGMAVEHKYGAVSGTNGKNKNSNIDWQRCLGHVVGWFAVSWALLQANQERLQECTLIV